MKKFITLITLFFFIVSCTSVQEAGKILRNEKIQTTDEFLVKKREPLAFPPNYDKIPEPGSMKNSGEKSEEKEKIKKILKITSEDKNKKKTINFN